MNKQEIEKAIKTLEKLKSKGCVKFEVDGYPCSSFIEIEPILTALEHQLTDMWIPVDSRLPELEENQAYIYVNATIDTYPVGKFKTLPLTYERKGRARKPEWCFMSKKAPWKVIAWRPLPEPWKEDAHE